MAPAKKAKVEEGAADAAPAAETAPAAKAEEEVKAEDVKVEAKEEATKEEVKDEVKEEKVDGADAEMKEEAPAEEEAKPPPFVEEEDAAEDKRKKVKAESVVLNTAGATPNVMQSEDGDVVMTLCDGGCQYFLAGVKNSVGIKSGRYMFEVKIVEMLSQYEGNNRGARTPAPKQLLRVGFSLTDSSNLLTDGDDQVYFDSDGHYVYKNERKQVMGRGRGFQWGQVIALVLNVDEKSPHKNTISLFRDGERVCEPQALPEALVGKALFPALTYRNLTLNLNWGPTPKKPLPFKCRMLKDAAIGDVELAEIPSGKPEVLFPVGIPEQGIFDWLDQFLEKNPKYLEMSDRKLLAWAAKSGLKRQNWNASNDKPGMNFGIAGMDDFSTQKALMAVVPALTRNFVCMELNANLQASERKKALGRFASSDFKRVAVVAIGEPTKDYKDHIQAILLDEKKEVAEKEKKRKEDEKRWQEVEKEKEARKRKAEEKKDDAEEAKEGDGEAKAEEEKKEEEPEEEKPVELTEEEKKINFRKLSAPDIVPATLARCFANYSLPAKDEGFDEVRYVWSAEKVVTEKLREWILENKKTTRIETLEPSAWFKEQYAAFEKQVAEWSKKQKEKKDAKPQKKEEKKEGEEKAEDGDANEEEEFDEDEVDVFTLENIYDIGNGNALFHNFEYEDWTLLGMRYEFHLLLHAFRRDVNDADRTNFHESQLDFYYNLYYGKSHNYSNYGVQNFEGLCAMIKDSVQINEKTKFIEAVLPEDTAIDKFMRQTEEDRRERQRCVDAGDESASIKFTKPAPQPRSGGYQGSSQRGSGGYQGRSSGGYQDSSRGGSRSGYGDRGAYPPSGGDKRSYPEQKPSSSYPASKAPRSGGYESSSRHSAGGSYGGSRGTESRSGGSSYGGTSRYGSHR